MTANLKTLNSSKTEFLLIALKQQLANIHNCLLCTTHSARNLGFIFYEHLSLSDHLVREREVFIEDEVSKSCHPDIHELHCIYPFLNLKIASTIATSVVHSKLDYCNSVYYSLPNS